MYRIIDDIKPKKGICTFELSKAYRSVFGLGERFDFLNFKGYVVKCGYSKDSSLPIPFFMTPDGFGLYVEGTVDVTFDFTNEGFITINYPVNSKNEANRIYYFQGTMKEILSDYKRIVGTSKIFPKWALGCFMGSSNWDNTEKVIKELKENKSNDFNHSAIVFNNWADNSTNAIINGCEVNLKGNGDVANIKMMEFKHNKIWKDFPKLISDIRNNNVKVIMRNNPLYLSQDCFNGKLNSEVSSRENKFVKKKKWVVMKEDASEYLVENGEYKGSMVVDFTSLDARNYWFNRIGYLKELGIDGLIVDSGNLLTGDGLVFSDGKNSNDGINCYANDYYNGFNEAFTEDKVLLSNFGNFSSPKNSICYSSIKVSTWEGLKKNLRACISGSLSGVNLIGFDIGGSTGYLPSKELYLRSLMLSSFMPFMKWDSEALLDNNTDPSGAWKDNDRSPWNLSKFYKDSNVLELSKRKIDFHYNLIPYLYMLMKEASETGTPIVRHLALEYGEDKATFNVENEFMLGPSLLIAPVLDDYIDKLNVYLPDGVWYNIYNNKKYKGGHIEVKIEPNYIPVFMKDNSCIPLNLNGKRIETNVSNDLSKYKELTFLVSGVGNYHFYDDLGNDISFTWDKSRVLETSNKLLTKYNVLHIEKAKIYK